MMKRLGPLAPWAIAALIWIAGVGAWTISTWPQMPLDLSPRDPATAAAFRSAVESHVLRGLVLAAVPAALLLAALAYTWRRPRP